MSNGRWKMNRAGLVNFWYYDEEIFPFQDGKLLLRGTNGSGKSVTMQSFLPVLLDGKKTPDRLDPFGSKARRMEDYLLGEKEVVDRDERTGYLFLEYKKAGVEQYITTGIGMQAKRNKGIKSWYFLITDNRRIGQDFYLAQKHTGEKVPLSQKELENRIGQGGYVVSTQREYMELVNKHIFGFQSTEAYEDLIKLLIQLRSPKLSKDFKPTVIYEILESALPPLTDDELRHLSDTIESMDQTSQQLEQLEREFDSVNRLAAVYDDYNKFILAERAEQWKLAQAKQNQSFLKVEEYVQQNQHYNQQIDHLTANKQAFMQQKKLAEIEKGSLEKHEVWSLEAKRKGLEEDVKTVEQEIQGLEEKWAKQNRNLHERWKDKEAVEIVEANQIKDQNNLNNDLAYDAEEAAFHPHEINIADYERHPIEQFDFTVWLKESKEHQTLLTDLEKLATEAKRLSKEHQVLQGQSSEKKKIVDTLQKEKDHLEEWFVDVQQQLENSVFTWMEKRPQLFYSSEKRQEIARSIQGLYERNRFEEVRNDLYAAIHVYEGDVNTNKARTVESKLTKQQEIFQIEEEIKRIKAQKMLEPERAEGTNQYREHLKDKQIAYIPFYAAVEFQDHVTEEQKTRIESALKQTGILDSVISSETIVPEEDAIFKPNPQLLGYTLADYLRPDLEENVDISVALVDQILRSISLQKEEGSFHIDVDGTYSLGCLEGHAPYMESAKYIGRTSRKRHQREQIQRQTEKLIEHQKQLVEVEKQLEQLEIELTCIHNWKKEIPNDQELLSIHGEIENKTKVLEIEKELLQLIDTNYKLVYEELTSVKKTLREKGVHLNISLTDTDLRKALMAVDSYRTNLQQFKLNAIQIISSKKQLEMIKQRIEEIEEELDHNKGEQNSKNDRLNMLNAQLNAIEQQLQLKGVEEVRKRIQEVQLLLSEADRQIQSILTELPKASEAQKTCLKELEVAKRAHVFWENMSSEWEGMVNKEKSLNFFEIEEQGAKEIFQRFEGHFSKHDRSKLLAQLTKVFLNEQTNLTEYRMFEYMDDTETPVWFEENYGESLEPFKREWHQLKGRRLIQMEYRGQRVSPYYVLDALKQELEDQKGWLDEQDRQLYEDIMLNTVGSILRNRIQRAQTWVKQMDKIMADRDNSSGLIFSIAWKPLSAETEQELDTKELVQLLQRNSKFLSEEDLTKITKHFQSRITKAKELIELRNEGSTLHQVLKEVLDYRKWFTFVLSYSRVNEPKRELTNNAFFKFSGGEKAMAMYIPLFTAAYSRYKEAGGMAPYIISLDEAFAGVDENNIRDMFEVVEQLGFNYIMNSQALWGDYDTISSLSIAELVRPKNADYVTVIRYEWDGKHKSLVLDDDLPIIEEFVFNE